MGIPSSNFCTLWELPPAEVSQTVDDQVNLVRVLFEVGRGVEQGFPLLNESIRAGAEGFAILREDRVHAVTHRALLARRIVPDREEAHILDDAEQLLACHLRLSKRR